ncbi:hypothetical protein [Miltoncostaea marina]|uniref:hypothetical protein n=1 Tax=Miltoncostaea marina TaxID=2843215 RepID=UPI001C3D379F|nr:hypothetical protein [Miltoncostaea marina]
MSDGGAGALEGLLGPVGAAALGQATRALARATDAGSASLRVAGWTAEDWAFRFELPGAGRHVVVHVPHDGGPVTLREAGSGPGPLAPEDLRRP